MTAMPEPADHLNEDGRTEWHRVAHGLYALRCWTATSARAPRVGLIPTVRHAAWRQSLT